MTNLHRGPLAALLLAALLVLAGCAADSAPGTVAAAGLSQSKAGQLCAGRRESAGALIDAISIGETALVRDSETGIFYYSMPENTNADTLLLKYWGADGVQLAVVEPQSGGALLQTGSVTLLAYTDTEVQTLTLVCTTLPILSLQVDGEVQSICKNSDSAVAVTLYDNRETAGFSVLEADGLIHVRGAASVQYPKKGYKLTLTNPDGSENDSALLGLRADGDWILYAAYRETEKVRQVFSARLWQLGCGKNNAFGVENSNEYRYVELFMNGRYWGLYALGYPIDAKQLELGEGEHSFAKVMTNVSESELSYEGSGDIRGYELIGGETEGVIDDEAWQPLRDYYNALFQVQDLQAAQALADRADMASAIDEWLFIDLIQGTDQILDADRLYNLHFAAKNSEDGVKILFTPWDFDLSWGYTVFSDTDYSLSPQDSVFMELNPAHILLQYGDPDIAAEIQSRWRELRQGAWSDESIDEILSGFEADIFASGAYERDHERWRDMPGQAVLPPDLQEQQGSDAASTWAQVQQSGYNEGQTDLSEFRAFVQQRFAAMDAFIEQLRCEDFA